MFKKIFWSLMLIGLIGVLVFGAVNRTVAKSSNESESEGQGRVDHSAEELVSSERPAANDTQSNEVSGYGRSQGAGNSAAADHSEGAPLLNLPASGELSAEETAGLLYMREEEKLAHDVYVTFYNLWGLPVFQNISQSEQAHTEAVKILLDRYELADPASGEAGVFTNPDLQALYDDFVARGSQSLVEALTVAAAIEEVDILDLESRLALTDNADIQQVYTNLLQGSSSHLRAFASMWENQTGETYLPQYLTADAYQAVFSSTPGNALRGSSGAGAGAGGGYRGGRP